MDGVDDWNCGQNGLAACQRNGQCGDRRHCRDGDLHMVRALIGADKLLQASIGILDTIHVSHVAERHVRLLVRHLARQRRRQ